jgi:hypothetical protein
MDVYGNIIVTLDSYFAGLVVQNYGDSRTLPMTPINITLNPDGKQQMLQFVPTLAGRFNLQVTLWSVGIANSPFAFNVIPSESFFPYVLMP